MSETLFVSDLHLQESHPDLTGIFLRFLGARARASDGLYILGDLFESWIGDDDDSELAIVVQNGLRDLVAAGVPCRFMRGNRDFLVGERFAASTGVEVLPDACVVDLYGTPTLLLHGDTLCTDDVAYQAVRRQLRDPAWQAQFLSQPLAARRAFAAQARERSRAHTRSMDLGIMDVTPAAVGQAFVEYGVRRMIHGHTHRPAVHVETLRGERCVRRVLSDWREHDGYCLAVASDGTEREFALDAVT